MKKTEGTANAVILAVVGLGLFLLSRRDANATPAPTAAAGASLARQGTTGPAPVVTTVAGGVIFDSGGNTLPPPTTMQPPGAAPVPVTTSPISGTIGSKTTTGSDNLGPCGQVADPGLIGSTNPNTGNPMFCTDPQGNKIF